MNRTISQIIKALCVGVVVALLYACGSSKTVDPLQPSRVIGLGDAYNDVGFGGADTRYTVRPLVTPTSGTSVVEYVASRFGRGSLGVAVTARTSLASSGIFSYAQGGSLVLSGPNKLSDQVSNAISDVGGRFNANDLIVLAAGSDDLRAGSSTEDIAVAVKSAVSTLLEANAQYVLVMMPIDIAKTPGGQGSAAANATAAYISSLGLKIDANTGSKSRNSVALMDPALMLNLLSASTSAFKDNTSGVAPGSVAGYCGAGVTTGCAEVAGQTPSYTAMFFADDRNLTPAGNRWVADLLFTATGTVSWR